MLSLQTLNEAAEILYAVAQYLDRQMLQAFDPEMAGRLAAWRCEVDALAEQAKAA